MSLPTPLLLLILIYFFQVPCGYVGNTGLQTEDNALACSTHEHVSPFTHGRIMWLRRWHVSSPWGQLQGQRPSCPLITNDTAPWLPWRKGSSNHSLRISRPRINSTGNSSWQALLHMVYSRKHSRLPWQSNRILKPFKKSSSHHPEITREFRLTGTMLNTTTMTRWTPFSLEFGFGHKKWSSWSSEWLPRRDNRKGWELGQGGREYSTEGIDQSDRQLRSGR